MATTEEHLLSEKSWGWAHEAYQPNIVQVVTRRWAIFSWVYDWFKIPYPDPSRCGVRISIAEMQRMYLTALKYELADIGLQLRWPDADDLPRITAKLAVTLEKYSTVTTTTTTTMIISHSYVAYIAAQAVRDYDYMITASQSPLDAFIISKERALDGDIIYATMRERNILMRNICTKVEDEKTNARTSEDNAPFRVSGEVTHTGPWEEKLENERITPAGGTRGATVKSLLRQAFWGRLGAALVGAVFLVAPLWLLALKQELYLQLGASTGFVLAFALIMAFFVEKIDQVFAGTLAYAAVLMVFVGVTLGNAGK